ncbi:MULTISPECIES: M23 family metallopeptidase [unclassified Leucobacter]|uniref:M23 family metallopeptidase n=1 Tax=unclassified Leucobacter TaxID=2621730 RepID=UPI00165D3999|nr:MULTISPECIES: M23 family metallopeptidase [unclassified Leucobacter]MBC9936450.1 M23 family metallopeptidase [Leucobacter sp. cx-87]
MTEGPAAPAPTEPVSVEGAVKILPSAAPPRIRPRAAVKARSSAAPAIAQPAAPVLKAVPVAAPVPAAPEPVLEEPIEVTGPAEVPEPVEASESTEAIETPAPTEAPPEPPALVEPVAPPAVAEPSTTTGAQRFRFDIGTIPLAPHSASLPLAAPVAPNFGRDDLSAVTDAASISLGGILRRSLSVTLAAASVAGLILTAAIPSLAPMGGEDRTQASAIQQLSLGGSTASNLDVDVVEGVDGAEVAADAALISADTFVNNPYGIVQYPFSKGVPLTDPFGYRTAPIAQFHDGQDFAAGNGAAIRSIADGTVLESGPTTDGCGTGVKIAHEVDGLSVESRYCHMQEGSTRVEVGSVVNAGQMIGRVGATGMSFGPHLHLVIQINGEPVDPMPFFQKYNAISR